MRSKDVGHFLKINLVRMFDWADLRDQRPHKVSNVLAPTPPPYCIILVLWQNVIRKFNVPGRLDTAPPPLTLSGLCAIPATETRTPLYVAAKCGHPNGARTRLSPPALAPKSGAFTQIGHRGDIAGRQTISHQKAFDIQQHSKKSNHSLREQFVQIIYHT